MDISKQIKQLCANSDITLAELARRLNKSSQNLNQKIKRGVFTLDDLSEIAMVTNCKLECNFTTLDGVIIHLIK